MQLIAICKNEFNSLFNLVAKFKMYPKNGVYLKAYSQYGLMVKRFYFAVPSKVMNVNFNHRDVHIYFKESCCLTYDTDYTSAITQDMNLDKVLRMSFNIFG